EISIFELSDLEIGQFSFAFLAHSSNFSLLIPGTFAATVRCDFEIAPSPKVISHLVSILSAVNPASFKTKLNFIEKQPACAAAISSSGFVPSLASPNLVAKVKGALFSAFVSVVNVPLPSFPVPCHSAFAYLLIFLSFNDYEFIFKVSLNCLE